MQKSSIYNSYRLLSLREAGSDQPQEEKMKVESKGFLCLKLSFRAITKKINTSKLSREKERLE